LEKAEVRMQKAEVKNKNPAKENDQKDKKDPNDLKDAGLRLRVEN
jgi:hypothetical protein